ncbi:MAG: tetratricopeptide repeat protein [Acidobacteria bacterium]|nr:tetratricopeptide repeat protein [Acidobacteriota bacterium]
MKTVKGLCILFFLAFAFTAASAQTAESYLAKCDASFEKGDYKDSVKQCTNALAKRPGFEEALITRAGTYKILRNYAAAAADYTELIRVSNGMAMAYFYRGGVYAKLGRNNEAIADYTSSVTKDPKGLFAVRSYYERGLLHDKVGKPDAAQADYWSALKLDPNHAGAKGKVKYPFGDLTLTEAAERIVPNVASTGIDPPTKPTPSSSPIAKAPPSQTVKTLPATATTAPTTWKRMELTGTGVSVASPMPYVLKGDKPDPLLEKMEARVRWELVDGGLWATVQYTKWDQGFTTVRQTLENTVSIVFEDPKAGERFVKDTTFLGEPAAVVDQERFDPYDKKQVRQKMIVFGKAGDNVQLNFVHPAGDKAAAEKVDQILSTFQKSGAKAVAVSKLPPAIWKTYNYGGLLFDFPAPVTDGPCGPAAVPDSQVICGEWGNKGKENLSITISYRNYGSSPAPDVKSSANGYLTSMKKVMGNSRGVSEFKTEPYQINAGEAVKVEVSEAYSSTKVIFIARGTERWEVSVWNFNRWDAVRDALKRILTSVRFKTVVQ